MIIEIKGKSTYSRLEGGAWFIQSDDGTLYQALNMPVQYQSEGCKVDITARVLKDVASIGMQGTIIRILRFETLT